MTGLIHPLLAVLLSLAYVTGKSCDILENMSCKCHSSFNGESEQLICNTNKNNNNNQMNTTIMLTKETLQTTRSFDSFHLTFYDQELTVSSMFINALAHLFPRTSTQFLRGKSKPTIKITLSFPNFLQLHFEDYAFYQLFGDSSDAATSLILELTSNGQITFAPIAFHQLKVDRMVIHCSSLEPYSFEEIFNNTNIGDLTMEGLTPRSNDTLKAQFNGKIQAAKFTKMVDLVSSEEFPDYPVRTLTIEAHEARRMNTSTFINYRNLHGFHLIRPKFFFDNRSFDGFQYLTNLESIELDAENIKDHTFQHASRIRSLVLGQNIRYLSEHSLDHLNYLKHFDVSQLTLDQLHPSARCVLARYIDKQHRSSPAMTISPPQAEYCDCIYDFILAILEKKPENSYMELCENNQQERCQLSECDVVKNFRLPPSTRENSDSQQAIVPSVVETIADAPLPFYSNEGEQSTAHRSPSYVHRHPSGSHPLVYDNDNKSIPPSRPGNQISQVSALKVNEPHDPNAIPEDDYQDTANAPAIGNPSRPKTDPEEELERIAMKNERLKWISLSLVCITILCLLFVGTLIWFLTCRPTKQRTKGEFKLVNPPPSNV